VKTIPPEIKDYLSYDPESGVVTWKKSPANVVKVEDVASTLTGNGYLAVRFQGKDYLLHRVIWYLHYGENPVGLQIDHINRDRTDNRIGNLRLVTHQQNVQNSKGLGVCYHKRDQKWRAQLSVAGKRIQIGSYDCPLLAGIDYLAMKSILHPKANV
jgi:hypothetical protein